jgi:hypothetical protein
MTGTGMDCDTRLAGLLFDGSPAPDAAAHEASCSRCSGDAPAARTLASAFADAPAIVPSGRLSPGMLRAAAPLLAANALRLPPAAWPRMAAAIAVAVLPLPAILFLGWHALEVANRLLSSVLPATLSLYLVATHAAVLALLLGLTYGAVPLLAAHQLRLQHEDTHV